MKNGNSVRTHKDGPEDSLQQLCFLRQGDIMATHPWWTNLMTQVDCILVNGGVGLADDDTLWKCWAVRPSQKRVSVGPNQNKV